MDDVLVEKCYFGVKVINFDFDDSAGVGILTNVEIRDSERSGIIVEGDASITLIDATKVHNNCIGKEWSPTGDTDDYGLEINGNAATIQLVFPLTKDKVSFNNKGGGNAGPYSVRDNIKTISKAEAEAEAASTGAAPSPSRGIVGTPQLGTRISIPNSHQFELCPCAERLQDIKGSGGTHGHV